MITSAHAAARERVWAFAGAPVQDGRVVIDIDAALVTAHSDIGQHHSGSAGPPSISHTRLPSATHQNAASAATGLLLQLVDEFRGLRLGQPLGHFTASLVRERLQVRSLRTGHGSSPVVQSAGSSSGVPTGSRSWAVMCYSLQQ
jgi:hypothetical protein